MRTRRKKSQGNNLTAIAATQAKSQFQLRPLVDAAQKNQGLPQTPEAVQTQLEGRRQGFNFAAMPIFAATGATPPVVQPKLVVSEPRDKYEQQADLMADKVVSGTNFASGQPVQMQEEEDPAQMKAESAIQREAEDEDEEDPAQMKAESTIQREAEDEEDPAQMKAEAIQRQEGEEENPAQAKALAGSMNQVFQRIASGGDKKKQKATGFKINLAPTSSGKSMPKVVQQKMEGAFGTNFSGVRIHEGPQAKAISAVAYTQGSNIHFQPGKYQPETKSGQELLGHELTHVVQQRAGKVAVPQAKGLPINADRSLEAEADALGVKAARGEQVQVAGVSSTKVKSEVTKANARTLTTKNDISFKNSQQGREVLTHEPTHPVQQTGNTIQRKTRDLEVSTIKPFVTMKSFFSELVTGDTKTEIIRDKIHKYNNIDIKDTSYSSQKAVLREIIEKGKAWKEERTNPSILQKGKNLFSSKSLDPAKQKAIEEVQQDAAMELLAVRNQKSEAEKKSSADASKTKQYAEELWGGVEGKVSEGLNVAGSAAAVNSGIGLCKTNFTEIFEGGKKAVEDPKFAKGFTETVTEAGKSIFEFVSKWGIIDIASFIWSLYKIKNVVSDQWEIENADYAVGVRIRTNKAQKGDLELQEALSHGKGKVERRFYSNLYAVVNGAINIANRIVTILSGFTTAPLSAIIGLGQIALNVITTAYRKSKGLYKLVKGTRGKHRKQSSERIVDAALNNDEAALKLLVGLKIKSGIQSPEDMYKFLKSSEGILDREDIKEAVADKLKSQA